MFQAETTAAQYAIDTLDPVAETMHIKNSNYHYYLCLQRKYNKSCCPLYLTREGYEVIRTEKAVQSIRIHTDAITNVLSRLEPQSLTVFVAMDHMDWFPATRGPNAKKLNSQPCGLVSCLFLLQRLRLIALRPLRSGLFIELSNQEEECSGDRQRCIPGMLRYSLSRVSVSNLLR